MNTLRDAFWLLVLGVVVCFAFFFALGAISTDAVGLMAVMIALALLWLGHAWLNSRHAPERGTRFGDRERRGF